jgi:hypothetical protein
MKSLLLFRGNRLLTAIAFFSFVSIEASAQFTQGNLVVLQAGTGAAALSSAATPIVLKEYNTTTANQASPVKTVYVDTTGTARITLSGTATSEGQMTLSSDSTRLVIAGYDAAAGTTGITGSTSASIPRVIDTVTLNAIPGRVDTTQTVFSAGNIRSAARNGGENYWATGSNTGLYYMGNAAAPDTIYNATANLRTIQAMNGKLYFSTASGLSRIGRINSQPVAGFVSADTMITLGSGTTPSPYGFSVNSAENIVYVADDRTTSNSGGIQKWTRSGTTWTLAYTLSTGGTNGARSVTIDWSGTYPVIYAITTNSTTGTLIRITDSNATGASPAIILATAPANTAFRSVAMVPKPGCTAPVASITPNPVSACQGTTVTLHTNSASGLTYTWKRNGVALTGPGTKDSTLKVLAGGIYKVIVQNTGGCLDSSANDTVTINLLPVNSVSFISNDTVCVSDSIMVRASTGQGNSYQWLIGLTVTPASTDSNFALHLGTSIITPVSVALASIITSAAGCKDTSSAVIAVFNPLPAPAIVNNAGILSTGSFSTYQWYMNGSPIAGATGMSYTPAANGNYSVSVTNSYGCSGMSATATVSGLNVPTLQSKGIHLYPNPVTKVLHIDAPFGIHVVIRDMQGRIVRSVQNAERISMQDIHSGVFAAFVYDASGVLLGTQMIVKTQ